MSARIADQPQNDPSNSGIAPAAPVTTPSKRGLDLDIRASGQPAKPVRQAMPIADPAPKNAM